MDVLKTLDEIAIEQQTDKATVFTRTYAHPKGYAPHYDRAFEAIRHDYIKVLEIGVGGGESIRTWLEYFPNAKVFGVDNASGTNPWNTVGSGIDSRYTFVCGDQSDEVFWKCFIADYGSNWDVLVDDGGHASNQIITTWRGMWPHMAPGGLYCIEDLCTAYAGVSDFLPVGWQNHMDFVKDKLDDINRLDEIASLHFYKELAIFKKA